VFIQRIGVGCERISVPAVTVDYGKTCSALAKAKWQNADGTHGEYELIFELMPQSEPIDWDAVEPEDLYTIEAVDEDGLIGRSAELKYLVSGLSQSKVPSFIVHGQKRVGKTSIVKTVKTILEKELKDTTIIYTEGGDFRKPDAISSVNALGAMLCKLMFKTAYTVPKFDGTLLALLDEIELFRDRQGLKHKFIFIIDEFDELPVDVYKPGPIGDSLFLNLRSLSSKDGIGFVIVGSEKMDIILNQQGSPLNKWRTRKVDYFSRDEDRPDFF
jgi:hypothetical protein